MPALLISDQASLPQRLPSRIGLLLFFVYLAAASRCAAQAGPPYLTDDPDPVPLHHFEAYAFELSDSTPSAGASVAGPSFEMNWGAAPNLQLHLVVPFVNNLAPNQSATHGFGDIELGAKYKFFDETRRRPEIGIFPFIELPAGDASRGLGVGSTWYRLPVWIKKGFGNWSVYTGGGEVFAHGNGFGNYPFVSALLERKLNNKLTLGGELFAHASEGSGPSAIGSATLADFGGFYSFTQHFQLMAAAGHSVVNGPETYTYLAAYWTWGKDPPSPPSIHPPPH